MTNKAFKTKEKGMTDYQPPANTPAMFIQYMWKLYLQIPTWLGETTLKEIST